METQRWINQSQPQTLMIAVFLLYFDAAWALLFGIVLGGYIGLATLIPLAGVAAGWGIANERKWAYWLGVAIAVLGLVPYALALVGGGLPSGSLLGLLFAVAKLALLVHPQSREYQKIWFR